MPSSALPPVLQSLLSGLDAHRRLIERAIAYFGDDFRVRGLHLMGPLADGEGSRYADVDLLVVVAPEHLDDVRGELPQALEALGHPTYRSHPDRTVLFRDGTLLKLTYLADGETWSAPAVPLLEGCASLTRPRTGGFESRAAELAGLDRGFWLVAWRAFSLAMRAADTGNALDVWRAIELLTGLRATLLRLLELDGRREGELPVELVVPLEQTLPAAPERVPILKALLWNIWLYRRLRDERAAELQLGFDAELEQGFIDRMVREGGAAIRPEMPPVSDNGGCP